ncbi:F-box/LRR-repeat protein At5g02910-like [Sorghum bicolor]|uniref:F-box domain-containing protein n=2 Tax=Sorghum bicolor TaxID=4558 RepID=A0A1Z5R8M3_SORBI|nr:F-box/LRR-repeat protein At5g02910-like [Sorghum bicolor]OQU80057.1 hypothetical protein SORBI_3007G072901 [Sorghum bicolor]|eukprot:XP_021320364.1 F-box/LRR-repeat protein At5g02910-like [Sorghum bicolor]
MLPEDAAARGRTSGGGDRGGDRLSGLRDEVLLRVLSHLKAWEAVRTFVCVLSQWWRYLWTYTGHLDIRQPCLCRGGSAGGLSAYQRRAREKAFNSFVRKLLLLRRLLVLLISVWLCWNDGDTNTWISHVVRHKAEEIELSAKHHNGYPTPEYMSFIVDGEALVKQGVAGEVFIKTGLKILKLIHLSLDDTTLTQLCSRCTSLEQIELNDCLIAQATKIQSKLLKRLTVIKCKIPKGLLSDDAPNLVSLQFSSNFGYVPWIQNLGLLAASNVNQRVTHKYPDCSGLGSCNLEILKLSGVKLDDTTLAQLCSRCTSLEGLELKDCLVVGKEIRSPSLRCLTVVSCEFATESVVHAPNLVSLCCTRPFRHVPQFQNMEFLVTASITLDDSCMPSDSQWTLEDDDKDEFDDDGDFFAHFRVKDFDDNTDSESDQDEEDESDHDGAQLHILVLTDQMIIVNMNPFRTKKMSLTMMVPILVLRDQMMMIMNMNPLWTKKMSLTMMALRILMVIMVVLDLVMTTIAILWTMKRFQRSTTMIVDECLDEMVSFAASQKLEQWTYLPIQERCCSCGNRCRVLISGT